MGRVLSWFRILWMLLFAVGLGGGIFTLLGFMGKVSWQFDLLSHFRVQYLFGMTAVALILLAVRRYAWGLICLGFAVVNLVVLFPYFLAGAENQVGSEPTIRVLMSNINTQSGDPEKVHRLIEDIDPDIIVLEELGTRWLGLVAELKLTHPYSCMRIRDDNFGIGLFCKYPLVSGNINYFGSMHVPSVVVMVDSPQGKLNVVATHPIPPFNAECAASRNEQLEQVAEYIGQRDREYPLILLGDLNTTPWNIYFKKLLKESSLIDSSGGWGIQPSWPTFSPLLWIPLDHCLHSEDVSVMNRETGPNVDSDHYPLILDIGI